MEEENQSETENENDTENEKINKHKNQNETKKTNTINIAPQINWQRLFTIALIAMVIGVFIAKYELL